MRKLVLIETALSLLWRQIDKNFQNYKGNIDSKQQQSILWFLGSNVNKVIYVTPENTSISFKKLSFLTHKLNACKY